MGFKSLEPHIDLNDFITLFNYVQTQTPYTFLTMAI